MDTSHDDEQQKANGAMRGEWFAQQLGPEWWSAGDGIYRHALPASLEREPLESRSLADEPEPTRRGARPVSARL